MRGFLLRYARTTRGRAGRAVPVLAAALAAMAAGPAAGGPMWNQRAYDATMRSVSGHVPRFPARQCVVTDPRYAGLVRQVVDGPGSAVAVTVWYYGDAINAAIAACHAAGGGTVIVPPGGSRNGG